MDVKHIAIFKTIKKVLSERLDCKTKLACEEEKPLEQTGPVVTKHLAVGPASIWWWSRAARWMVWPSGTVPS